jgi:hypothetical protein
MKKKYEYGVVFFSPIGIILVIIILVIMSCQKDRTERWICYKTTYSSTTAKCGCVSVPTGIWDSFNIDADKETIAIFMSQNNFRDSTGFGYSWECKLR